MPEIPNDLILFCYPESIYARRVVWYLTLRGIQYAECIQPPILPRPDLLKLGIHYRRIPLLYFRGTVYADSRLILRVLEAAFPYPRTVSSPSPSSPSHPPPSSSTPQSTASRISPSYLHPPPIDGPLNALPHLLSSYATDGGVFRAVVSCIPPSAAMLQDVAFLRDRDDMMFGIATQTSKKPIWTQETQAKGRPEALSRLRCIFDFTEGSLLAGEKEWVTGTNLSLVDLEAIWPLHWATTLPHALPPTTISAKQYPKTFAWIERFNVILARARKSTPRPVRLSSEQAVEHILSASSSQISGKAGVGDVDGGDEKDAMDIVDEADPLDLRNGDEVEIWPTDSGFGIKHRDHGKLVQLTSGVAVIVVEAPDGGNVRLAVPRWGFRIVKVHKVHAVGNGGGAKL